MTEISPSSVEKKTDKTVWIVLAIAFLVLCCCLALLVAGLIFAFSRSTQIDLPLPGIRPSPTAPAVTPPAGRILVEPYRSSRYYPTLQELTPDWEASKAPATHTWQVQFRASQAVMILLGWCTTTREILDQNYEHIRYSLTVDGQAVDVYGLFRRESMISEGVCRSYQGIIRSWPEGTHTITMTMEITEAINDGWSEYPAGEYTDIFEVTVLP